MTMLAEMPQVIARTARALAGVRLVADFPAKGTENTGTVLRQDPTQLVVALLRPDRPLPGIAPTTRSLWVSSLSAGAWSASGHRRTGYFSVTPGAASVGRPIADGLPNEIHTPAMELTQGVPTSRARKELITP